MRLFEPRLLFRRLLPGIVCVPCLCLAAPRAEAQFMDSGIPGLSEFEESGTRGHLTTKSVSVVADIRNGLVTTTLTTVFANTLTNQAQASLNLDVPHDSVVSGYAYWFKGQKVAAKLLDNDKAWEIYRVITSHQRDPAIMEQWGDCQYHLQVYPVEPGKDLRMEVHYVSPLESDKQGLYFRLPMPHGGAAPLLDSFNAKVTFRDASGRRVVGPGFNITVRRSDIVLTMSRSHWRQPTETRVRLLPRSARFESIGLARATSGSSGFFNAVFWTPRRLTRPQIRVTGAGTHSVFTPGLTRKVPGGRRLLVVGRFAKPGPIRISIRDARMAWVTSVLVGPTRKAGPVAAKRLWAASEIKRRCGSMGHWDNRPELKGKARTQVVRMSMAYGVVSPYTAWLAVPKSENEFYLKHKDDSRAETNTSSARGGDPLIRIQAPRGVVRVTAYLPTGEPVRMIKLADGAWEGRFDMPAQTAEGLYRVTVLLVHADGTVKRLTISYLINRHGPSGLAGVTRNGGSATVSVAAGAGVKAAWLVLPNGNRISLNRSGATFSIKCDAAALRRQPATVVLVDAAHNVTRLTLDPQ